MHADKVDSPVLNADFHQSSDIGGAEEVEFSPNECFAVEVFCGSAGLTAEMRNIFPTSYDIDHKVAKPLSKVIVLDLEHTQSTVAACVDVETGPAFGFILVSLAERQAGQGKYAFYDVVTAQGQ